MCRQPRNLKAIGSLAPGLCLSDLLSCGFPICAVGLVLHPDTLAPCHEPPSPGPLQPPFLLGVRRPRLCAQHPEAMRPQHTLILSPVTGRRCQTAHVAQTGAFIQWKLSCQIGRRTLCCGGFLCRPLGWIPRPGLCGAQVGAPGQAPLASTDPRTKRLRDHGVLKVEACVGVRVWRPPPVIPAVWEAETRGLKVQIQPG